MIYSGTHFYDNQQIINFLNLKIKTEFTELHKTMTCYAIFWAIKQGGFLYPLIFLSSSNISTFTHINFRVRSLKANFLVLNKV